MNELGHQKLIQYLFEAHAVELQLLHTLTAHAAMTPAGSYRDALTDHIVETKDHAQRIQEHLAKHEGARSLLQAGYGLATGVVGQVMAFGKLPVDLVRGMSGEEKLVKNARDEATSEAQEIAMYLAIEHMARELGDNVTVKLAREIREEEERMLVRLQGELPSLVKDVVKAQVKGDMQYDVRRIGAVDAVRTVAGTAARVVTGRTGDKNSTTRRAASTTKARATSTAKRATNSRTATSSKTNKTSTKAKSGASRKRATAKKS